MKMSRSEDRQAQDSLAAQMERVVQMAERAGEYDAAMWIRQHFTEPPSREQSGG
jgi:hypothetical protein